MFSRLTVFQLAMSQARYAGKQQAVAAENMANADTPGYAARRMASFKDQLGGPPDSPFALRTSRIGHSIDLRTDAGATDTETSPNGNAVSIETEMLASIEASRLHDRAMAIYRSHLNILRAATSRG